MKTGWTLSVLVVVGCLALSLSGCTKDPAIAKQRNLDKARDYYAKSQYNEAIIELKNALQIDPKFPPAVHLIGRAYVTIEAWEDALREAEAIAGKDPTNAWALYFRAAALNAKGQRQDALAAV